MILCCLTGILSLCQEGPWGCRGSLLRATCWLPATDSLGTDEKAPPMSRIATCPGPSPASTKDSSSSGEDLEPATCARNASGQGRRPGPSTPAQAVWCYSNGGISDEWGKLFLLPEGDKNPFDLGKQCPYVGASASQPAQAWLCASRQGWARPGWTRASGRRLPLPPIPRTQHTGSLL